MAERLIAARCTEPVPAEELAHLVKLIIREIRRHRHPDVKVRDLVADEQRAKDFLFEVIKKKKNLALRFEFMSIDQQMAERAERFRSLMVIEPDEPAATTLLPVSASPAAVSNAITTPSEKAAVPRPDEAIGGQITAPPAAAIQSCVSKNPAQQKNEDGDGAPSLRFPEQDVISRVAVFLNRTVGPIYWGALMNVAASIARNSSPLTEDRLLKGTMEQVIWKSQPNGGWNTPNEELEYFALWLVHFLFQCGADGTTCTELLCRAMDTAAQIRSAVA